MIAAGVGQKGPTSLGPKLTMSVKGGPRNPDNTTWPSKQYASCSLSLVPPRLLSND
jgi:hypothetical protein